MNELLAILQKLQSPAYLKKFMLDGLIEVTPQMKDLNIKQLEQSINSQGDPLPLYKSRSGMRKGKARWDLHYSGHFYDSLDYKVTGTELEITYDLEAEEYLIRMAGYDIDPVGLTDDSLDELAEVWITHLTDKLANLMA